MTLRQIYSCFQEGERLLQEDQISSGTATAVQVGTLGVFRTLGIVAVVRVVQILTWDIFQAAVLSTNAFG